MRLLLGRLLALVASTCLASGAQEPLLSAAGKKLILTDDLIAFHKNLTQIESISGNEREVGEWLLASLKAQGYHVEKQEVQKKPERFNVLAWPGEKRDAKVVLSSHIDTVPPFLPYQYTSNGSHSTIFGRGSVDAKGSVATQIIAVNELLSAGSIDPDDVAVLFVVGEEVGGAGMRTANDLDLHPQAIIFGEPTEGKLASGHKGILQIVLSATGKSGHSGYPWLGRSANEVLVRSLGALINLGEKLPKSDKYGTTTFNLGRMEGGVAGNVIAEMANASVAVRIAAGEPDEVETAVTKAIHHAVQEFLEDGKLRAEDVIDIDFSGQGYGPIAIDADVPGFDVFTVNYGTDIPWLKKTVKDQKRYLYGPGSILVAHSANEEILESDLFAAVEDYQKIILHALGKGEEKK
ncbi:acetylornithine deacetylase like protein [Zymoseptoria brevis]|uniref:Acetylornithine deacetylase like protein n=1 Tax=Zymoseptoria brevis TaxID=1047168 RepID=A0A0F4GAK1_9PEZI|nr:acetylornithine deacetylase like protein [Zymoseptoria brevis]